VVTYDELDRVTILTNALGAFTNDYVGVTGRISTNYFPNGQQTVFSYHGTTNDQRLQTIHHLDPSSSTLSKFDYTYDAEGQIETWTRQTGTTDTNVWVMQYDPVDQLLGVTVRSNTVAGAILKQYFYGYDQAGNRTSEQIDTGSSGPSTVTTAGHNTLNQLTGTSGGGPVRFAGSLDELGTVTVAGIEAPLDSRTTNFVGYTQLTEGTNNVTVVATDYSANSRTNTYELVVTNNGAARTLSYDANGNLASVVTATSTNSYDWDAADRLVRITRLTTQTPSQLVTAFGYDGQGRRVQIIEEVDGTPVSTNRFVWCGTELCEERDATGATVAHSAAAEI
jgi:YD repeat-containing protein